MSPLHFVIMLIIAIIILTVLTLKFKMHPVMVLFLTATFCGLASGKTLVDTFGCHYQILRLDLRLHWCYDYFWCSHCIGHQ